MNRHEVWAALAQRSGRLPSDDDVVEAVRCIELDGPAGLDEVLARLTTPESSERDVRVVVDQVLVDLGPRGDAGAPGVPDRGPDVEQDVVLRELLERRPSDVVLVEWREGHDALWSGDTVVVPVGGSFLSPRDRLHPDAAPRLLSLVRHAGLRTTGLGFGCASLVDPDRSAAGLVHRLAALKFADQVVALGPRAAGELRGWRRMLGGAGLAGPEIVEVRVPTELPASPSSAIPAWGPAPRVVGIGSGLLELLGEAGQRWARGEELSLLLATSDPAPLLLREVARHQALGHPVLVAAPEESALVAAWAESERGAVGSTRTWEELAEELWGLVAGRPGQSASTDTAES